MSDPTGAVPAEGAAASESPASSGPDLSPVMDRMSELAEGLGSLRDEFGQFTQAQQPEPEAEPTPWETFFGEPEPEAEPQTPPLDMSALQQAIRAEMTQAQQPLMQQLQALQMERATATLYKQIPQLEQVAADHPDYAAHETARTETAARVQQALANYAPEVAAVLSNDPNYIATIFKAAEADKLAQGQEPAGGAVPSLEAAGGAHPGGDGEQVNPVHSIMQSRQQGLPKGFG